MAETNPFRFDGEGRNSNAFGVHGDVIEACARVAYFKALSEEQQVLILDAYWRGIREVLPEAFDEPSSFSVQKGIGVMVLHTLLTQIIEIARSGGHSLIEPTTFANIMRGGLERLEGENATGDPVSGLDFWRAAPDGAAGSYSSSAGRRVLMAKIHQRLPRITVQ